MKAKLFPIPLLLVIAGLTSGCSTPLVNLTPERLPQNPSGIYTLSMSTNFNDEPVVEGSVQPSIVIDGQKHRMQPSPVGEGVWDYDYHMPENRDRASYYYVVTYQADVRNSIIPKAEQSDLFSLQLVNRYVIMLESERGPVGSVIPVVGRGFSEFDQVIIGEVPAQTTFGTPNSISFVVPPLQAGHSYPVELESSSGRLPIGVFHVDPAEIQVSPSSIQLKAGERSLIVVGIGSPAPEGGIAIEALTDIPDALIMPEIVIPAGSRTVSIPLQGAHKARGILVLSLPGFTDLTVPVSIQ